MRYSFPALLAATFLLGVAAAAPVPKNRGKPALYFPTKVGTKLVYEDENGGDEQTYRVSEAKEKDGAIIVTVEMDLYNPQDGKRSLIERVAVSEKGVFRLELGQQKLTPPLCLLQLPCKAGDEWNTDFSYGTLKSKGTAIVCEHEEIKVPAGKFTAIPINYEYTIDGITRRMTEWYAPEVGVVKKASTQSNKPKVNVLKAYVIPQQ
jgi:hypothetical protein